MYAEGFINLLNCYNEPTSNKTLKLNVLDNDETEIDILFDASFENAPRIDNMLSLKITDFYNFGIQNMESIQACFRFPFDQNFRAALLYRGTLISNANTFLLDDFLKQNNFEPDENPMALSLLYENYQTNSGLNLLRDMIENHQKMVIELKYDEKMYMTFVDLTIFNHPGVFDVTFIAPLYEWNGKLITNLFQHEAYFTKSDVILTKKKRSKLSLDETDSVHEELLIPILSDGKCAALKINLNISKPVNEEKCLNELFDELNKLFSFMLVVEDETYAVQQSEKDFYCIVTQTSKILKNFINANSMLSNEKLIKKFKEFIKSDNFCIKDDIKQAMKDVIGNTINREEKTETNLEFKILMMDAFKILNQKMCEILIDKHLKALSIEKEYLDDNTRKYQMEEFIAQGNFEMAEKLINRELDEKLNESKLKEKAFYLLKLGKFDEVEMVLKTLLRIHKYCTFTLYILCYVFIQKFCYEGAAVILEILTKLQPDNMEFWILLSELYTKIGNFSGEQFCAIKIQSSKFIQNHCKMCTSSIHPRLIFLDPLINIQWNQLQNSLPIFLQMTEEFERKNERTDEITFYENMFLKVIKLTQSENFEEALNILGEITMDDENEISLRILKGNILYGCKEYWKAVCEYEIAFHLSQKFRLRDFPLIPCMRCAEWYLNETGSFQKSLKYFQFCFNAFGTLKSLIGLGKVYLKLEEYQQAEKCFVKANMIDQDSGEIWLLLALTNCKLQRFNIVLNCYLTAIKNDVKKCEELTEVEQFLGI